VGIGYCLINKTKQEMISYCHLPASTAKELTGNSVTSAITTWYLIKNSGDEIGFVPDQYREDDWPYKDITWKHIKNYNDLTDSIIHELIEMKILVDNGIEIFDKNEPDIYIRLLKNVW